jgi:hypothetical protein
MKIKLTLVDLYGNNIITYKDISLVCKLDQYIDNFPTWIANKKERWEGLRHKEAQNSLW